MSSPLTPEATRDLLHRARQGDQEALNQLLAGHRAYMKRIVELRMDHRVRNRLDPSDVVQEAMLDAARELPKFLDEQPLPFHLWLRQAACDRLALAHRHHLAAECRNVDRELALSHQSSIMLARGLPACAEDSPLRNVLEEERAQRVRDALARLADPDAEIILLRNLEELSNAEAAQVLGIEPPAASKRYARALLRLELILRDMFSGDSQG